MRNPRDVFTSSFHFHHMASFLVNPGPQGEFLHKFLDGKGWTHYAVYSISVHNTGRERDDIYYAGIWHLFTMCSSKAIGFNVKEFLYIINTLTTCLWCSLFQSCLALGLIMWKGGWTLKIKGTSCTSPMKRWSRWDSEILWPVLTQCSHTVPSQPWFSLFQDLKDAVSRLAQFLEKPLDNEVIEKIAEGCLFEKMKQNNMSNHSTTPLEYMDQSKSKFLRKGVFQLMTAME